VRTPAIIREERDGRAVCGEHCAFITKRTRRFIVGDPSEATPPEAAETAAATG
jgi:hypothetical protein